MRLYQSVRWIYRFFAAGSGSAVIAMWLTFRTVALLT